jgi:predicted nucleic acid-binding protein
MNSGVSETNGMTERLVYLDANIFIYAVEGHEDIADPLRALFDLFRARRGVGVTSELTLAEVLAGAGELRRKTYLDLLVWSRIFDLQAVTREILIETAEYRRHSGMPKLPDAIHAVTAIRVGCRSVLTADARLRLPNGFSPILPSRDNLLRLVGEMT